MLHSAVSINSDARSTLAPVPIEEEEEDQEQGAQSVVDELQRKHKAHCRVLV
jgi:hypothetical protein